MGRMRNLGTVLKYKQLPLCVDYDDILSGLLVSSPDAQKDIRVGCLNINSLASDQNKIPGVACLMLAAELDVLVLVDTRLTLAASGLAKAKLLDHIGLITEDHSSLCILFDHHTPSAKVHSLNVGGQLILIGSKWARSHVKTVNCPFDLGVLSSVTLKTGAGDLLIIGTYWPANKDNHEGSGSLYSKIKAWMLAYGHSGEPIDKVKQIITERVGKHLDNQGNSAIVLGDLNSSWASSHLTEWAVRSGLHNKAQKMAPGMVTRVGANSGTWIDHILCSGDIDVTSVISDTNTLVRAFFVV
jgi:hypothetical protein